MHRNFCSVLKLGWYSAPEEQALSMDLTNIQGIDVQITYRAAPAAAYLRILSKLLWALALGALAFQVPHGPIAEALPVNALDAPGILQDLQTLPDAFHAVCNVGWAGRNGYAPMGEERRQGFPHWICAIDGDIDHLHHITVRHAEASCDNHLQQSYQIHHLQQCM